MHVDDTKDRIYIHDLDAELSDTESESERVIFISDIEQKLSRIPKIVLTGSNQRDESKGREMVLYSVPTSLSVPQAQDSVRKAIIDSRARAREKQLIDESSLGINRIDGLPPSIPTKPEIDITRPGDMMDEDLDAMDMG